MLDCTDCKWSSPDTCRNCRAEEQEREQAHTSTCIIPCDGDRLGLCEACKREHSKLEQANVTPVYERMGNMVRVWNGKSLQWIPDDEL